MKIVLDVDIEKVMEFMVREIPGDKLLFVARAVAQLAELGWADAIPNVRPRNGVHLSEACGFMPPVSVVVDGRSIAT
jgi:hypothetical protein